MSWVKRVGALIVSGTVVAWASSSMAQAPTPGEVQETLKKPRRPDFAAPVPEVKAPPPRPTAEPGGKRVLVSNFIIRGAETYSAEKLHALIADWEGKRLTLEEIYKVSDVLSDFYHAEGYNLTVVTVPAQKVRSGVIHLRVVEGKTGRFAFSGNEKYSDEFLERQLDGIAPGTVLRFQSLERELLLLDDLPGLTARSVIQPGEEFGTSEVLFKMEEDPYEAQFTFDNHGTELIGEWRVGASLAVNNPTGRGDRIDFGVTYAESGLLDNLDLGYSTLFGNDGARLGASFARANYDVGGQFRSLGISGETETVRFYGSYPWIRSRETNLVLEGAVSHQQAESSAAGVPVSDTELTVLEAVATLSHVHQDRSITTVNGVFSTNFRNNPSGLLDNRQPGKLDVEATHERMVSDQWSLFLRGQAVLSIDPLVDAQKFSLGGPASVRGYTSAFLRGDQGLLATVEARRPFSFGENLSGSFRLFADAGLVHQLAPAAGQNESEGISSVGVGLTLIPRKDLSLDLQWAIPTDDDDPADGNGNGHLWVGLTANL